MRRTALAFGFVVAFGASALAQPLSAGPSGYGYYPYSYGYNPPLGLGDWALPFRGPGPYTPAEDYYGPAFSQTYNYGPAFFGVEPAYRPARRVRRGARVYVSP